MAEVRGGARCQAPPHPTAGRSPKPGDSADSTAASLHRSQSPRECLCPSEARASGNGIIINSAKPRNAISITPPSSKRRSPSDAAPYLGGRRRRFSARSIDRNSCQLRATRMWSQASLAQDDYTPIRWLTMSASGRLDHHTYTGTFFSPRVSALLRRPPSGRRGFRPGRDFLRRRRLRKRRKQRASRVSRRFAI